MAEHKQRSFVPADAAEIVSQFICARQKRAAVFSPGLFSDPAWDILLALFLTELRQQKLATTELALLTPVPLTTALRWIDALEQKGWVRRTADPSDQRRIFVDLSARGSSAMHAWVKDWIETQPKLLGDDRVRDILAGLDRRGQPF
jgi:DNA-binding MarR family transcriptional regulator